MAFPFKIEFNEKLQVDSGKITENEIIGIIEKYLKENSITEWETTNNKIAFKSYQYNNSYSSAAFSGIDQGEFIIEKDNGDYILIYKFYYIKIIIIVFVALTVFSILTSEVGVAIIGFLLLIFGGVTLSISRQNTTYYKIIELLNPNFVRPKLK